MKTERVGRVFPEADEGGAREEERVAGKRDAEPRVPKHAVPRRVPGGPDDLEVPTPAAHVIARLHGLYGNAVEHGARARCPHRVREVEGNVGREPLRGKATGEEVSVLGRGERAEVGERLLAHQDARAGVGQLARKPGVVLVRVGDEHGRARGVYPEAHERAHEARVVVVV